MGSKMVTKLSSFVNKSKPDGVAPSWNRQVGGATRANVIFKHAPWEMGNGKTVRKKCNRSKAPIYVWEA